MTDSTIIAALISGVVVIIGGMLTLRGRKEEVEGSNLRALIDGQRARIDQLQTGQREQEDRMERMECRLDREQRRSNLLFDALNSLVTPLRDFEDWIRTGAKPPPPPLPKSETIQRILDENARNPPVA